jgi:hypothetical protein
MFSVTYNALNIANNNNLKSISIPAISTGIFGFPIEILTKVMFEAILQYIDDTKNMHLEEIHIINDDINIHEKFCKEFERRFENINPLNQYENMKFKFNKHAVIGMKLDPKILENNNTNISNTNPNFYETNLKKRQ